MKTFRKLYQEINAYKGCALTIGNFDGLHLGHQAIIRQVKALAAQEGLASAVMSFSPHPRAFFEPQKNFQKLLSNEEKEEILAHLGIDYYFDLPFNKDLANYTAEDFVEKLLVGWIQAKHIVVGDNFYFGKNKKGDVSLLRMYENKGHFKLHVPALQSDKKGVISSSRIRSLIAENKFEDAEKLLGHKIKQD